jgi:Ca2+-binding EF-hand superfamily protein
VRNKRLWVLLTIALALALVVANTALTQFQGPGRGGRGGRGGGMGGGRWGGGPPDPNMIFNFMSQGKDYIVIAEMRRESDKTAMTEYAQSKGISNGQLTREQFADYWQQRMAQRQANRGGGPGGRGGGDPAKDAFDRMDVNKDGVLSDAEIPGALRSEMGKWDSNRDGKIQLDEYRAFFKASAPAEAAASPGASPIQTTTAPSLEELDKRATVYRAGNLPRELQRTWFEQYDTDKDGQVGLYEWKEAGESVATFRAIDANGDGFITAEEALRYVRKNGGGNTSTGTAVAGGPGNFGRGQGGFGWGQGAGGWGGQQGMGGMGGPGRWQGGPGNFNRGPGASASDGNFGDRQRGGGRGRNRDRGQGGGGGGRRGGGGMYPGFPGGQ